MRGTPYGLIGVLIGTIIILAGTVFSLVREDRKHHATILQQAEAMAALHRRLEWFDDAQILVVKLNDHGEPVDQFGRKAFWMRLGECYVFSDWVAAPPTGNPGSDFEQLWLNGDSRVWKTVLTREVLKKYPPPKKGLGGE